MAPPSYADLGKSAKDLFTKGYNVGFIKVESTSKTGANQEIEFKTGASHTVASGTLAGNLDVKYKIPAYGITLTEKWNTENILGTVIEVQDQLCRGLKLTLDSSYAPQVGKRSAKVKADWTNNNAKIECDVGVDAGPTVNLSAVGERDGWLFGLQTSLDTATNKIRGTNVAFGMRGYDFTLHSFVNNGQEFGASLFHQAANNCEIGAQLGWTVGEHHARFGLATKYCPSKDFEIKAKVNSDSNVAFAATHYLSNQLKLILSTQVSLAALHEGGQKFGLGLEYNP